MPDQPDGCTTEDGAEPRLCDRPAVTDGGRDADEAVDADAVEAGEADDEADAASAGEEDDETGGDDGRDDVEDGGDEDVGAEGRGDEGPGDDLRDESGDEADGRDDGDDGEVDDGDADDEPEPADAPLETDGEGVVGDAHRREREERPIPEPEEFGGLSTPPDDEEMPLADHIEEMISRLAVVLLFAAAGTAIGLLWASDAIALIWADVIPGGHLPHLYHPLELWLTRIKVAALLGIMVGLPMFVYQCYLFMRPGLYPHERKYYLAAVPTSVVLAGLGMLFSYLLVLPVLFAYFTYYSEGSALVAYGLGETFNLVITLTGFLAIVFQIPLFIMLAIMMGVTTRRWLEQKRLYFWAAFLGVSFMFTVDPTMMAPFMVTITMILLFEGTLLLLRWTGRG